MSSKKKPIFDELRRKEQKLWWLVTSIVADPHQRRQQQSTVCLRTADTPWPKRNMTRQREGIRSTAVRGGGSRPFPGALEGKAHGIHLGWTGQCVVSAQRGPSATMGGPNTKLAVGNAKPNTMREVRVSREEDSSTTT